MKQKALEILGRELREYGIITPLSEIIGKTVCIIGDEDVNHDQGYHILVLTKIHSIVAGADGLFETATSKNWAGLCDLHLANGGRISLVFSDEEKERKMLLQYVGPDCYRSEDIEYFVQVHFMD